MNIVKKLLWLAFWADDVILASIAAWKHWHH